MKVVGNLKGFSKHEESSNSNKNRSFYEFYKIADLYMKTPTNFCNKNEEKIEWHAQFYKIADLCMKTPTNFCNKNKEKIEQLAQDYKRMRKDNQYIKSLKTLVTEYKSNQYFKPIILIQF